MGMAYLIPLILLQIVGRAHPTVLNLLEEALAQAEPLNLTATIEERLLASVARDVQELLPSLEQRGQVLTQEAQQQLQQRGEREARAMRDILEE